MLRTFLDLASKIEGRRQHEIQIGLWERDFGVEATDEDLGCGQHHLSDYEPLPKLVDFCTCFDLVNRFKCSIVVPTLLDKCV